MITFRDTGSPVRQITGGTFVIAGGLTLDSDPTGLPRITLAVGTVGGAGTTGTLPKWTGSATLGNSLLVETASTITLTGTGTEAAPSLLKILGTDAATAGDAWLYLGQAAGASDLMIGVAGTTSRTDGRTANNSYIDAVQTPEIRAKINGTTFSNIIKVGAVSSGGLFFYTAAQSAAATLRWTMGESGHLLAGADNTYDIGASGATRPRTAYLGTSLILGATPSTTGAICLTNNTGIYGRNAANSADIMMLTLASGNDLTMGARILASSDASYDIGALGSQRFRDLFLSSSVSVGASPALSGGIRLPNSISVKARGAAGAAGADVSLISLSSADNTQIMCGDGAAIQLLPSHTGVTSGVWNFYSAGSSYPNAFAPFNNNAQDIGASAVRIRDIWIGRDANIYGTATFNGPVTQPAASTSDSYFGRKAVHHEDYSVATGPTYVTVNLPGVTGSTTLLQATWSYRFELITQGTSTLTGAVYVVYTSAAGVWSLIKVSTEGEISNWPLLRLSVAGTGVEVYHNHASTYTIKVRVEAFCNGNTNGVGPALYGLESRYSVVSGVPAILSSLQIGAPTATGWATSGALRLNNSTAFCYARKTDDSANLFIWGKSAGSDNLQFGTPAAPSVFFGAGTDYQWMNSAGATILTLYADSGATKGDLLFSTLGKISNQTAPTTDYSLVYDGTVWKPRLINASVAQSGAVGAELLVDNTQAAGVNTQNALSGAVGTPGTPTVVQGYRCMIVTMSGASATNAYALDWTNNATYYATRFSITSGLTTLTVTGGSPNTFVAGDVGRYVEIAGAGAAGATLFAKITAYGTPTSVTVDTAAGTTVTSANGLIGSFKQLDQRAATTGSTVANVVASAPGWTVDQWKNYSVMMLSGSLTGQTRKILGNTTTTLTIAPTTTSSTCWLSAPANTDQFVIAPVFSTAASIVHANLVEGETMWYRYRIVSINSPYWSGFGPTGVPTAGTVVSGVSYVNAFGLVVASQLAVTNLSAIATASASLDADALRATSGLFRKFQISTSSAMLATTENRIFGSDGSLWLYGDTSGTTPIRGIFGSYGYQTGGLTPVSEPTATNNTQSVTISTPTRGAWAYAGTASCLTSPAPNPAAYNNVYTATGWVRCNCTVGPDDVLGYTSSYFGADLRYRINSGAWITWGDIYGDTVSLNNDVTIAWSADITAVLNGTSDTLEVEVTPKVMFNATKIKTGDITVSGHVSTGVIEKIGWSVATSVLRRGLYLSAVNSQPHLSLQPIGTAPTSGNTQTGEVWFNGTNHSLEYNSNGTVRKLNVATTGYAGLIAIDGSMGYFGGTDGSDIYVKKLRTASSNNIAVDQGLTSLAPAKGMALCAIDSTNAEWKSPTQALAESKRNVAHWAWRDATGAGTWDPNGYGIFGTSALNGAGASWSTPTGYGDAQMWVLAQCGASTAQYARQNSAITRAGTAAWVELPFGADPTFTAVIRTPTSFTAHLTYIGLSDSNQGPGTATDVTGDFAGFRIDASGVLTGRCVHASGVVGFTASLGTLSASTAYVLKMRVVGRTMYFSKDGGVETTLANTLAPLAGTRLGVHFSLNSTGASATSISLGAIHVEWGI